MASCRWDYRAEGRVPLSEGGRVGGSCSFLCHWLFSNLASVSFEACYGAEARDGNDLWLAGFSLKTLDK